METLTNIIGLILPFVGWVLICGVGLVGLLGLFIIGAWMADGSH